MVLLFDGESLDNFEVKNGTAPYEIEDGVIVGTTAEGSPNSFLSTKREYGDFILEFDVMVDPELNSGVQIRSHQYAADTTVRTVGDSGPYEANHAAGRVYGLQVEISNEEAGSSGGVYDEARRGWVHNIQEDPAASKALKDNEWNHYRIEAVGDSVKTFVNGVPCADLVDSMDLSGLIGFQVHSYEGDSPKQVRWKNIWIKDLGQHPGSRFGTGRRWRVGLRLATGSGRSSTGRSRARIRSRVRADSWPVTRTMTTLPYAAN